MQCSSRCPTHTNFRHIYMNAFFFCLLLHFLFNLLILSFAVDDVELTCRVVGVPRALHTAQNASRWNKQETTAASKESSNNNSSHQIGTSLSTRRVFPLFQWADEWSATPHYQCALSGILPAERAQVVVERGRNSEFVHSCACAATKTDVKKRQKGTVKIVFKKLLHLLVWELPRKEPGFRKKAERTKLPTTIYSRTSNNTRKKKLRKIVVSVKKNPLLRNGQSVKP